MPRTMVQEAYELHALLGRGGERPPYVLVGHSFAGLTMRIFAQRYPADVAGLVLVDATSEDAVLNVRGKLTRLRLEAKHWPIPEPRGLVASPPTPTSEADTKEFLDFQRQFGAAKISPPFDRLPVAEQAMDLWARNEPPRVKGGEDYSPEEMAALYDSTQRRPAQIGDMPLHVLIAGRPDPKPPNIADTVWTRLMEEKVEQKERFGSLSRRSVVRVIEDSGHHIQLEQPTLVVDAVRHVIAQWRDPGGGRVGNARSVRRTVRHAGAFLGDVSDGSLLVGVHPIRGSQVNGLITIGAGLSYGHDAVGNRPQQPVMALGGH